MGWCWPFRCKLRSLSPQRREDRGVSREVFSPVGSRPGLAPGCSANSYSPLSDPPSVSSSTASWMPVCLAGVGQTSPSYRAKGATELLPAGPALHGRAPLSKQTVQWATSHGQHGTCHYQPCMAGSLPKTQARPRAWTCTALDSNFSARVCYKRILFQNYATSSAYQGICVYLPLTNNVDCNCQHNFKAMTDKFKTITYEWKTWEWKGCACQTVSWD